MNILDVTKYTISELQNIPNHSQLCVIHGDIDTIDNKTEWLNLILSKLRISGELILSFIDLDMVLSDFNNNIITKTELCNTISGIGFFTDYTELSHYIMSLEPNISLYKHVRENYKIIISLVRKQY